MENNFRIQKLDNWMSGFFEKRECILSQVSNIERYLQSTVPECWLKEFGMAKIDNSSEYYFVFDDKFIFPDSMDCYIAGNVDVTNKYIPIDKIDIAYNRMHQNINKGLKFVKNAVSQPFIIGVQQYETAQYEQFL